MPLIIILLIIFGKVFAGKPTRPLTLLAFQTVAKEKLAGFLLVKLTILVNCFFKITHFLVFQSYLGWW